MSFHALQGILNDLLGEETVQNASDPESHPTQAMRQVRYLILRNKADILGKSNDTGVQAMQLYKEALGIDDQDASLFNKAGTLVRPSLIM